MTPFVNFLSFCPQSYRVIGSSFLIPHPETLCICVDCCHCRYGHGLRTLAPELNLMSFPEITCPFTKPGLSLIFRSGASNVPSTIALQQPAPPPPPEKATSEPAPRML